MESKVELMIVGAQKAGTTSLKNYLGQHPSLTTHQLTEFSFFVNDEDYKDGFEKICKTYFPKQTITPEKKIVAKNAGIYYNEKALSRLQQHNPNCIVVLIIRNPVERAYSSYNMEIESGWFKKKWNTILYSINKFRNGETDQMFRLFINLGMYSEHLKKIYKYFPSDHVEVVLFDDLKEDATLICQRLFRKLNIESSFSPDTNAIFNPTEKLRSKKIGKLLVWLMDNKNPIKKIFKSFLPSAAFSKIRIWLWKVNTAGIIAAQKPMAPEIRQVLIEFFKPYNEKLESMTGLNLKKWNQ